MHMLDYAVLPRLMDFWIIHLHDAETWSLIKLKNTRSSLTENERNKIVMQLKHVAAKTERISLN